MPLQNLTKDKLSLISPILLFSLLILLAVSLLQPEWLSQLRYERSTFPNQLWQSITHAIVHLNTQHLILNASTLVCIFFLFPSAFKSLSWLFALVFSAIVSSAGMYFYSPETAWCAGLSGALHGLVVYTLLRARASIWWLMALFIKIFIEQIGIMESNEVLNITGQFIQHNIVVDAHLWGAVGGLLFFGAVRSINMIMLSIELNSAKKP